MTKRTLTKHARTLVDRAGNVSIAPPQEKQEAIINIQMPNGAIKEFAIMMAPGQLVNQIKLRKKIIAGKIPPSVRPVDN